MTEPANETLRRRHHLIGGGLGLAGHVLAVAAAFAVMRVGTHPNFGGLSTGVAAFGLAELLIFCIGFVMVSNQRTRDLGTGLLLGWLSAWLLLFLVITINDIRYA